MQTQSITPDFADTVSRTIRRKFEEEYAASLKGDSAEQLHQALDIFERYARGRRLSPTESAIVGQVKLMSGVSTIRSLIVAELQTRKPANRDGRRAANVKRKKEYLAERKSQNRGAYLEAVKRGVTVTDVLIEQMKAVTEAAV